MTIRQWLYALFIALILTASARALDDTDYHRLDNLWNKFLQLEKDLRIYEHGIAEGTSLNRADLLDCLEPIYSDVERGEMSIGFLTSMAALASLMVDKSDEQKVLGVIKIEARKFLEYVEVGRTHINGIIGFCSRNNVVSVKAQEIFQLYDVATPLVRSFLSQPESSK
jgi:hypothetical protein